MGKLTYTKSQETAIHYMGGNLLLSAAAGSGKTATLTARIMELLLHGDDNGEVNLTDMLVVTYTRAAANELKGKIANVILEAEREWRADNHRSELSRNRFFRHLTDVSRADISTIHSFLLKALRPYFPALGLSPDMSIIDDAAAQVLKAAAMQDTIDDFFDRDKVGTEQKASFTELSDAFGAVRDAAALDAVFIKMADNLVSVGRDEHCLYSYADLLDADSRRGFFKSIYGEYIKDHIRLMLRHYRIVFSELAEKIFGENGKAALSYGPALNHILEVIAAGEKALDNGDYSAAKSVIGSYTPVKLAPLREQTEASAYFKTVRDRFKKDIETIGKKYFVADEASLNLSMQRTARILRTLGDVLGTYYKAFAKRKRARNALDYADLELYALKLFLDENGKPTDAAREVGERYKYIFIDEYQDTNHVQDDIFRAISGKSVRFMVGDIKQSIYRFRGAEPEVFSRYRDRFPVLRDREASEKAPFDPDFGRCVFMSENFRCDEPVVQFVNMISAYMFPYGGIPYTADDALIYGKGKAKEGQAPVEICLIDKPRQKKGEEPIWDSKRNPEAEYVANRIASMIGEYKIDGERPCRASDIAILLRTLKNTAEVYAEALTRRGIPVRLKTNVTPLSAKSTNLVLCILNLVDNPLREIYAAGAMRSPVFGFTTDDIVALKQYGSDLPLYMAVTRAATSTMPGEEFGYTDPRAQAVDPTSTPALSAVLSEKCLRLARWVKRHKAISRGMKADKYLDVLYSELELSSFPEIFGNEAERSALNRLYEAARHYESGRFGGLSGFIDYLEKTAGTETAEVGEENAVTIVSVHSAKGLEYPVCFLADCGKARNSGDEDKTLLFDPVMGFGMTLPDEGGLVRCDTAVRCGIAEKKRADAVHEEMRVLYVALTRARSRLIITAKTTDGGALLAAAENDKDYFTEWSVCERNCYRDMIINGAAHMGARDFYTTAIIPLDAIAVFVPAESAENAPTEADASEMAGEEPLLDFTNAFQFRYPLDFLTKIPSKLAVSTLSPNLLDDEENSEESRLLFDTVTEPASEEERESNVPLPSFMTGITEIKGSDRGTATHLFMQFMDLDRLATLGVDAELDRMVKARFLSPATAELVNKPHLRRFAESDLFRRMRQASMIRREFRFNVRMPAEKFTADPSLREKLSENHIRITVQGVVDCVFRDKNGLVLVDYKTDAMSREEFEHPMLGEKKLRRRHTPQLMYYHEICTRLFGEEIAETVIYSTTLGRTVAIQTDNVI